MFLMLAMLLTSFRDVIGFFRRLIQVLRNTLVIAMFFVLFAFVYALLISAVSLEISAVSAFHADAGVILGAAVWSGNGLGERPSPALRERIDLDENCWQIMQFPG